MGEGGGAGPCGAKKLSISLWPILAHLSAILLRESAGEEGSCLTESRKKFAACVLVCLFWT